MGCVEPKFGTTFSAMKPRHILIGGTLLASAFAAVPAQQASPLEATIRARLDSVDAHSTFYAKQLSTGREIAIRADEPMNTASVIKIPVMILAYRDADAGKLDLNQRYVIRPEDQRRGSGL